MYLQANVQASNYELLWFPQIIPLNRYKNIHMREMGLIVLLCFQHLNPSFPYAVPLKIHFGIIQVQVGVHKHL